MTRLQGGKGWDLVGACPDCGRPVSGCRCSRTETGGPPLFRLRMEKRRGKAVTVAAAERLPADEGRSLLQALKKVLATGGTLRDGVLELQGEHRDRLRPLLEARGYRVKG